MPIAVLLPILFGMSQAAAMGQQRPYLAQAQPNPLVAVQEVMMRGKDHLGRDIKVVSSARQLLRVNVKTDGETYGTARLSLLQYNSPDVTRLSLEADRTGSIIVRIPFGSTRPNCFMNYDGRDILVIIFQKHQEPRATAQSYANCGVERE